MTDVTLEQMILSNGCTHGGGAAGSARIQSALVSDMPAPIDIKDDIIQQGKADKWQRELMQWGIFPGIFVVFTTFNCLEWSKW